MKTINFAVLSRFIRNVTIVAISFFAAAPVYATEFMGVEIDEAEFEYVVLRDVNVRSKPDTKSKRLAGLKKGAKIQSPGRYKGWVAVLEAGNPLGFAYKKYLLPVIDGSIPAPMVGAVPIANDGTCTFTINFVGKSDASNARFKMADYETDIRCQYGDKTILTTIYMFMTEGPMTHAKPTIHQIGMDILEIELDDGYDDIFSTNVLYDHETQKIRFDGVTLKGYGDKPRETEQVATSVAEALEGAVQMALESWNEKTWTELAEER